MTATTETDNAIQELYAEAAKLEGGVPELVAAEPETPAGSEEIKVVPADPVVSKVEAPVTDATKETEPKVEAPVKELEPAMPEAKTEPEPNAKEEPKAEPKAEPTRDEKKAAALERTWANAEKRHLDAEAREVAVSQREQALAEQAQRLIELEKQVATPEDPLPKHSFDELAKSMDEFLSEGDTKMAKALVKSMVEKAKAQVRAHGPDSPQFVNAWEANRKAVVKANPELVDPKSPLFSAASGLLASEWAPFFRSHPAGAAAAVEVAKMQLQIAQHTDLAATVTKLETENQSLRKKLRIDGSGPVQRETSPPDFSKLTADQQIAQVQREAELLDSNR